MSVHTNNTNLNPYSNTPIKNLEYIQNKALVIAPFEITKSGLIDTDLMLDTPGFITMYFFRKNFNSVLKEPTAEQFKVVGTVSDISTKLGLDITTGNISSSITSSYYLGSTKIAVTFKYDKNTGIRTIEKDTSLLVGDYTDISIDSTCDLTTEDYFVICNVTKNTKATNSSFTESSSMDFLFMIPSSECQEIITDFTLLDANNQVINVKKYGTLGSGFVADNDTTFEPAYLADFFGDGSNIATYLFDGTCRDLNGNYNGTATNITYGEGKVGQAAVFNGTNYINSNLKNQGQNFSISTWIYPKATATNDYIIGKRWNTTTSDQINIAIVNNTISSGVYIPSIGSQGNTFIFTPNTWYHVVVNFTPTSTSMYVNGDLIGTKTFTAITYDINYSFGIGRLFDLGLPNNTYKFNNGNIDSLRFFNRALNQNEVTALYLNNASTRVIKQESNLNASDRDYDFFDDGTNVASFRFYDNIKETNDRVQATSVGSITFPNGSGINGGGTGAVYITKPLGDYTGNIITCTFNLYWNGSSNSIPIGLNGAGSLWFNGGNVGLNTGNGDLQGVSSSGLLNVWKHFVVEFHTTEYGKLYIDGVLQTLSKKNTNGYKTPTTQLGDMNIFNVNYPNTGTIQNLKIFNRALTQSEVNAVYGAAQALNTCPKYTKIKSKPDFFKDGSNIATYLFNGNCNDETGNNISGVLAGGSYVKGKFGQAVVAPGISKDSYVNLNIKPNFGTPTTVSFWVKGTSFYLSNSYHNYAYPTFILQKGNFEMYIANNALASSNVLAISKSFDFSNASENDWNMYTISIEYPNVKIYINGKLVSMLTMSQNVGVSNYPLSFGNYPYQGGYTPSIAYISPIDNVRIFNRALNQREVLELYNEQPSLLEQYSLNEVTGKTLTPNGNPLIVHDFEEGPSVKFVNNRDYLSCPGSNDFAFGTGDFTVESWVKFNNPVSTYPTQYICGLNTTGGIGFGIESGNLAFGTRAVAFEINFAWTPTVGVWYHLAATRENGIMKLWINGSNVATKTNTKNLSINTGTFYIGAFTPDLADNLYATVKYLHIIKGVAKYTTNFNRNQILTMKPLQTPNTVFLLQVDKPVINTDSWSKVQLESVEVIDQPYIYGSSLEEQTSKTLTSVGTTLIVDDPIFSKVLKFDGSNYINISSTQDLNFGTGDFTIETWMKRSTDKIAILFQTDGSNSGGLYLCHDASGYFGFGGIITSFATLKNTWYHIAMVRKSGTYKIFINGTCYLTTTNNNSPSSGNLAIGTNSDWRPQGFEGYIYNLNIIKGEAKYQTDFKPNINFEKVVNTSLLIQPTTNQPLIIKDPKRKDFFGDKSMIACYMLDSNANDETGMYNGTATNITYTDGKFGKCGVFNKSTYIDTGIAQNSFKTITVSAWAKFNTNTVGDRGGVFGDHTGDFKGIAGFQPNGSGGISFAIGNGSNWNTNINGSLTLNTWVHLVGIIDLTSISFYINGTLVGTLAHTGWIPQTTNIIIGRSYNNAERSMNGQIDNVKIFNRALTASEVTSLYNETISPIITLETERETIASEPDFFNDKSNIATYLFEEVKTSFQNVKKIVLSDFVEPMSYKYLQWYFYSGDTYNTKITNYTQTGTTDNTKNYFSSHQDSYQNDRIGNIEIIFNDIIPEIKNAGFRVSPWISNNGTSSFRITAYDINNNIIDTKLLTNLLNGTPYNNMVNYGFIEDYTNGTNPPISFLPNIVKEANGKYNGTATNITYGAGKFGMCASFNGNLSLIDIPNTLTSQIKAFSANIKFNTTYLSSTYSWQFSSIICWSNTTLNFGILANGKIRFYWYDGGWKYFDGITVLTAGIWYNISFSINGNMVYVYLNGSLEVSATFTNFVVGQFTGLRIGYDNSANKSFDGQIDNVRIFNRALTASEVQDLYRETKRVKYKAITLDSTNFGPAAKFNIETQKEIKLLNYKTWTGTDATLQGYRIYPVMKIQDHTAEETSFSPKYYLGAKYQRNLAEVLMPALKSKRTIFNLKDMYLVDDLCIQTLKKINILLENNQLIKFTERLYNLTTPIKEKLNADLILEYLSTPVTGSVNSDIAATLKTSLITDYNFTQAEIDNLNDNLNTFKSRARMNISAPVIQGTNGSLDQVKFTLPKTFVDGNRSQTEKKNLLVFGTDAGFNKFGLSGYSTPYSNVTKRDASAVLNIDDLTLGCPVLSNYSYGIDTYTKFLLVGGVDLTGKVITYQRSLTINTSVIKFNPSSMKFVGSSPTEIDFVATSDFAMGLGDFTIDGWINTPDGNGCIFTIGIDRASCCYQLGISGGVLYMYYGNATWSWVLGEALTCDKSIPLNEWVHIAIQRKSGTCEIFINGIKVTSKAWAKNLLANGNLFIGTYFGYGNTYGFNGYIDSFRISKGIARYQSDFIPSSIVPMNNTFKDILTNYKQQIPFSYIPLSTDPANTNNEPVFENLTNITGFDHSEIVIDLPNVF